MTKFRLLSATLLAATAITFAAPASAQRVDRIVAFGDSYADDGNLFQLTGTSVNIYPTGRFSGGTNYIDTLSQLLAVPVDNFAIGGAKTDNSNTVAGQQLGFERGWRDAGWMIMRRGALTLEFFPFPDLDPLTSSFGCCLRLDDLDAFYAACVAAGVPEQHRGHPRLHPAKIEHSGMRIAYLVDPDGTLLRLVENKN